MDTWLFVAYKVDGDKKPYFAKLFHDFNEMKYFSAKHASVEKKKNSNYCSDYIMLDEIREYKDLLFAK